RLADETPVPTKPERKSTGSAKQSGESEQTKSDQQFNLDAWIAERGIYVVRGPVSHEGGRKFTVRCPFNLEHDNAAIFESEDGKLGFHCFHNSCHGRDWHAMREHVEPEYRRSNGDETPNPTDVGNAKRFVARHGKDIR